MSSPGNPALSHFQSLIGEGLSLAEIWIAPRGAGYELRHVRDREGAATSLKDITAIEARSLSNFTAAGAFRPIKASPDLVSGWRLTVADAAGLEFALNQLYPGAIADLHAIATRPDAVTQYRDYTNRQTGMYRITAMLSDAQAAQMTRACCGAALCLKQRLWTVPGLEADTTAGKSLIPCLEPCPLAMEFARKVMRGEQDEPLPTGLRPDETAVIHAALELALRQTPSQQRVADFNDPLNSRRLRFLLEKFSATPKETSEE